VDVKSLMREVVVSVMGLSLVGASIYLAIQGELPMEYFCTLVGMMVGFFVADRKNGKEIDHIERVLGVPPVGTSVYRRRERSE